MVSYYVSHELDPGSSPAGDNFVTMSGRRNKTKSKSGDANCQVKCNSGIYDQIVFDIDSADVKLVNLEKHHVKSADALRYLRENNIFENSKYICNFCLDHAHNKAVRISSKRRKLNGSNENVDGGY